MKTVWIKGLDIDAQEEIQLSYQAGGRLRARLAEIVADKMDAKVREAMSAVEYENPNWAYKQADSQGYLRALKEITSLITESDSK